MIPKIRCGDWVIFNIDEIDKRSRYLNRCPWQVITADMDGIGLRVHAHKGYFEDVEEFQIDRSDVSSIILV